MTSTVYLNGAYVPEDQATVPVTDRGLQFADSVYEVILVASSRPVDLDEHLARLKRSMRGLKFQQPADIDELRRVAVRLIAADAIVDGMIYMQVTRGVAARNLVVGPAHGPTILAYAKPAPIRAMLDTSASVAVITLPDQRWKNCHIKTTALVANVLAKLTAQAAGCDDAWLVDPDGYVTEACAANAWIVRDGVVITRPEGPEILSGVTRARLIALASKLGLAVEERKFTVTESRAADEAFASNAGTLIVPVRSIDGTLLAGGAPGPVTMALYAAYLTFVREPLLVV